MAQLGKDLRSARIQKGMTQEEAAKLIGAARTTLVAIEGGSRRLKAEELIKLAHGYGRQVGDFVRARPRIEPFSVQLAQFRGPWNLTDVDRSRIEPAIQSLEELCRDCLELEEITDSPLHLQYPEEYAIGRLSIVEAAENVALDERRRLGLGDGPLSLLRDILEQDVALRVFYMELPHRFSEIYVFGEQVGGCISVNRLHPEERRRWSLAHAYGHFLAHRRKPDILVEDGYQRRPASEQFADSFASFFLLPTSGVARRFNDAKRARGKVALADLFALAHYYGVAVEAFMRQLEGLHLLPTGFWDAARARGIKVRDVQDKLGLGSIPCRDDLLPMRYQLLAVQALDEQLITEGQFAAFMRAPRLDARSLAASLRQKGDRDGVTGTAAAGLVAARDA
jgi:Zn-dependent peptidase ImmA (M78 family)/DNA-binding XRE family transcriptional regulator